ncbi:MAG TPA: amidohydrolase/deacetylase family metallohydrolase [Tepidisphaeraceae bacterium]|nr:amidohydrolase/deacetylase family metallohydrolase [Tepidisphaeraceae bacterium]
MKLALIFALCGIGFSQTKYDLLLQGGHVIDAKNGISALRDVGIKDGKIAAVAAKLDPKDALKTVNVGGLHVTPGLIDIHVHVFTGTGERNSYAGDNSIPPDGFTFRVGVTTVADAGCAGWRNFEEFKDKIIDRSKTRVLAFLNIVGNGMRGGRFENDLNDMAPGPAADMAKKHKGLIVGFKSAHYAGKEWTPVENAVTAGNAAGIPVMVDFGNDHPERPLADLLTKKLRPGDIYTHCFSGLRHELLDDGQINPGMIAGRKRGVIFDVGHGGGSFAWRVAVPFMQQGFLPDSISTDLHIGSMNAGMKDMLNVMDKFMAMGMSLDDVVARSTWNPAKEIHHEELGNLSVGAPADITVLRVEKGVFGFTDMYGARMDGEQRLAAELTLRDGRVVYDLNGITRPEWTTLPKGYTRVGDAAWDTITPAPRKR